MMKQYDTKEYLAKVDAWWRAADYLSVGQMYLKANPLLREKLKPEHLKVNPIGHWGTISGQNFIYAHLNRVINKYDLNMFYIEGPGHGGQVMVSNSYLDGSYSEIYPEITQDESGMQKLFKQFSFPGGIGSHAAPETPGSIHEGGELGYSLSHGTGAILDNPEVIAATVIGDGEAETGPLAASWFANTFINPVNDGAVLPILHLNGAKIANPTLLARKSDDDLEKYFQGMGWDPVFIEGDDPKILHPLMAEKLDGIIEKIKLIQNNARKQPAEKAHMPNWPLLVVRTPKGWGGPEVWEGKQIEGSYRSHQVPIPVNQKEFEHADALVEWLESYKPDELFDESGKLKDEIAEIRPTGDARMAKNPITNGGINVQALNLPDWKDYTLSNNHPGSKQAQDMSEFGKFARDIVQANPNNFRIFGPDETNSNRLNSVFEVTQRQWLEGVDDVTDEDIGAVGRVIDSQLSEHQMQGMLEGYTLTGRYGFFASYEAFLRVADSMITQHFKWIRKASLYDWRRPYQSLNLISSSTVFQQDHNGYTHQDPGIITLVAEKKPEFTRVYLPADTNILLATMDKVFRSQHLINLVVSSKHPRLQFYSTDEAEEIVNRGLKVIDWASTVKPNEEPDVVIVAAGSEPNLEALASVQLLMEQFKDLKIRFVNVVDLLKLRSPNIDPRGFSDEEFDGIFTKDKPIFFAYHGFEGLIRDIFFSRSNHQVYIHGYREEGDITTPFDMRVMNELDRYHLAKHIATVVVGEDATEFSQKMTEKINYHHDYIREHGIDMPEVLEWKWTGLE